MKLSGRFDRMINMDLSTHLKELRQERRISQLQLADNAGVNHSVVKRAEAGGDAKLSTWIKLFEGLGYFLRFETLEQSEEASELLSDEAEARRERRIDFIASPHSRRARVSPKKGASSAIRARRRAT
jgi:transcriptional regulator with XRE-family HTH domain